MEDGQADDENADAREDFETAMLRLGADLAGRSEDQNQAERVEAVLEPVRLVVMTASTNAAAAIR